MIKLSLLVSAVCAVGVSAQTPVPAPTNPPPIPVERTLVIAGQGHFPVALRLQDGRIAALFRGPGNHLGIDGRLDMVFSSDEGKTWTAPSVVVDSPLDDRNPAFGQASDGTLVVGFWRIATYDDQGKYNPKLDKPRSTWITRSRDGGATWQAPRQIDVSDIGLGSPYGRIVTLPGGAMLMAIYGEEVRPHGEEVANDRSHSYVYRSEDQGQSWKRLSEIGDGKLQLNETSLLRLPDGRILAAVRARATDLWTAESTDEGKTWSAPVKLTPANVHPGDLCLLTDGRVLLTVGDRVGPFGVLGMVSDSAGRFDWNKRFTLINDARSGDCGYPSSVQLKDGQALTLHYATRVLSHPDWKVHCGAVRYTLPK
jgi:hypothetical protein